MKITFDWDYRSENDSSLLLLFIILLFEYPTTTIYDAMFMIPNNLK